MKKRGISSVYLILFSILLILSFSNFVSAACSGTLQCSRITSSSTCNTIYTAFRACRWTGTSCVNNDITTYDCTDINDGTMCAAAGCTWTANDQCASGPCCDTVANPNVFRPTSYNCATNPRTDSPWGGYLFACVGGDSVTGNAALVTLGGIRVYCTGSSSSCSGTATPYQQTLSGAGCTGTSTTFCWGRLNATFGCGSCTPNCQLNHASYNRCVHFSGTTSGTGTCAPVCSAGWCNSDGNNPNGCEAALGTNLNCAYCGNNCGGGRHCDTAQNPDACVADCAANYGQTCYGPYNSCNQRTAGTYLCSGACSVTTAPANPSGYGNTCYSAYNSCNQRNSGTIGCSGTCSATVPAN
ncbi:MAG: hypothetical protein NTZ83_03350, partial [Candidatus Pacearchaeota archaeon]|nr:hypothetical protein [Candidatus Pacearchaeota archaeon]